MQRILTALILLPFLIASILVPWLQLLFVAMAAAAMVFALYEFYVLARKRDMKPDVAAGFLGAAALFTNFFFAEPGRDLDFYWLMQLTLIAFTAGVLIAATLRGAPFDRIIASSGATILGVLYIVLLGGHLVAVRMGFEQKLSAHLLSFFFLVLFGADTGAY